MKKVTIVMKPKSGGGFKKPGGFKNGGGFKAFA